MSQEGNTQNQLTQGQGQGQGQGIVGFDPDNPPAGTGGSGRRDTIIMVVLGAIIAFAIVWIMVPRLAPGKAQYQRDITRLEVDLVYIRDNYVDNDELDVAMEDAFTDSGIEELMGQYTKTVDLPDYNNSINSLNSRVATLESAPPESSNSLEYSASGTFGSYTLSAKSSETGDFLAKITLVYTTPSAVGVIDDTLSDATKAFYSSWLTTPDRQYECELMWDSVGSIWKVKKISFHTGKFTLTADTDWSTTVLFSGPKNEPHEAYVEIIPVLATSGGGGGGI